MQKVSVLHKIQKAIVNKPAYIAKRLRIDSCGKNFYDVSLSADMVISNMRWCAPGAGVIKASATAIYYWNLPQYLEVQADPEGLAMHEVLVALEVREAQDSMMAMK